MTGTFEYGRGDKRALPDFNVFFRYHANYPYLLGRHLVPHADAPLGPDPRGKPDAWYVETAKKVYRPDVYRRGREGAGRREEGERGGLRFRERRLPRADEGVHRRRRVRRPQAECLHREARRSASRASRKSRAEMSSASSVKAVDAPALTQAPATRRRQSPIARRPPPKPYFPRVNAAIDAAIRALSLIGLGFLKPIVAIMRGEDPRAHMRQLWLDLGAPIAGHRRVPAGVEPGVAGHPDQPRADSRPHRGVGTDQGAVGRSPGAA